MNDQYIIILHRSPETVAQRVSEAIGRGYWPYGNLFYTKDTGRYAQALTKVTPGGEQ